MSPEEIYRNYVRERRAQPIAGYVLEALPHLTRCTAQADGGEGFVMFANLPDGPVERLIDEQLVHFEKTRQTFEWKVYDFDQPPTLKTLLERRGFGCDEEEAFLVLPVMAWPDPSSRDTSVRIEKITNDRGLRDVVAVQAALYPQDLETVFERYSPVLRETPNEVGMFCAYLGDRPVGTGWIDFPGGSFADLHGGAVLPTARGQGIFSALLHTRILAARERGYAYLAVDTTRMSRPILLKKGFQHVCYTYPLRRS